MTKSFIEFDIVVPGQQSQTNNSARTARGVLDVLRGVAQLRGVAVEQLQLVFVGCSSDMTLETLQLQAAHETEQDKTNRSVCVWPEPTMPAYDDDDDDDDDEGYDE